MKSFLSGAGTKLLNWGLAWGPWGAFLLAIVDSAGIPLPGGLDALLLMMAAHNPRAGYFGAGLSVVGSLIGSVALFMIARKGGEVYLDKRTQSKWAKRLRRWFHHYGAITVLIPTLIPIPGLPLKVFVLCAGALGMRLVHFALIIFFARIARYFALAYVGAQMGVDRPMAFFQTHRWQLLAISLVLFGVFYIAIKLKDRAHIRARHPHLHPGHPES